MCIRAAAVIQYWNSGQLWTHLMFLILEIYNYQAFIQALLSTVIIPQRFSFFTVCLVHYPWPHGLHWKENFWNSGLQMTGKCISSTLTDCRSIACTLLINAIFFGEYWGLVINTYKIASRKLVPMAQVVIRIETTCASSINLVWTVIKDWCQTSKTVLKTMLVCYHLTISKVTMTGSVGHVSD